MPNRIQQFNFHCNLLRSILWQHEGAPGALSLAYGDQTWFDNNHSQFWQDWYDNVFNLTTANTFGLAVWLRILNFSSGISFTPIDKDNFGFNGSTGVQSFDEAGFAFTHSNINLSNTLIRSLLLIRWFNITESPTVYNINRILAHIFGPQMAFVTDTGNMTIGYTFNFEPSSELRLALEEIEFLPRPSTVEYIGWVSTPRDAFGFNVDLGDDHDNFNNNSFLR